MDLVKGVLYLRINGTRIDQQALLPKDQFALAEKLGSRAGFHSKVVVTSAAELQRSGVLGVIQDKLGRVVDADIVDLSPGVRKDNVIMALGRFKYGVSPR